MSAYRNRPDRRKPQADPVEPISNPVMTFTATYNADLTITVVFDQPIIAIDPADPVLLNSVRIWVPDADYEGTADGCTIASPTTLVFTFGGGAVANQFTALWFYDLINQVRGLTTGARCTGNPYIFERV